MLIHRAHDRLITMTRSKGTCLNRNCYTIQYNVNFDEVGNANQTTIKNNIAVGSEIFSIFHTFKRT